MSTFVNNLCPIERAVFRLYPARIAACVAFRSIMVTASVRRASAGVVCGLGRPVITWSIHAIVGLDLERLYTTGIAVECISCYRHR